VELGLVDRDRAEADASITEKQLPILRLRDHAQRFQSRKIAIVGHERVSVDREGARSLNRVCELQLERRTESRGCFSNLHVKVDDLP